MSGTHSQTPLHIEEKVLRFQAYVSQQYSSHSSNWPLAKIRIQDVAESIVSTLGLDQPPIDLDLIAGLFDIKVSIGRHLYDNVSAQLIPSKAGFQIIVAQRTVGHLATRWRFSLAHELGHTLFFSAGPHGPERIFPTPISAVSRLSKKEEGLCDSFAAALLVPTSFRGYFPSQSPTMAEIIRASLRFEVTPDVVVRRLLHDFRFLESRAIYAVRLSRDLRVNIFRGRRANRSLPTANHVKSLLTNHDRADYVSALKQKGSFSDSEFCVYGGRTLYVLV
jgi:Zn-dependent peptidase ImmA (M78 family)